MGGIEDDQFRKVFENNVLSNHWLIQMVAPKMIERNYWLRVFLVKKSSMTDRECKLDRGRALPGCL
jgi:hypothetical protein